MADIRDEIKEEIKEICLNNIFVGCEPDGIRIYGLEEVAKAVLTILQLAVVDRKAEIPSNPNTHVDVPKTRLEELENMAFMAYLRAQQDMIKAGFVKEIRG